jgi:hypothetical protein
MPTVDITKTHMPVTYVVVIVGAIVGGALGVARSYNAQAWEVRTLREKIESLATKEDLHKAEIASQADMREFARERVKFYLEHAALRVAKPTNGKTYMTGKVEFPIVDE